jgi:hypothetical protein
MGITLIELEGGFDNAMPFVDVHDGVLIFD